MNPILWLIITVIEIYMIFVIAHVILSWLVAFNIINTHNRFVAIVGDALYRVTEPGLRPIRRILPSMGGLDLSPLVLIVVLIFLQRIIVYYFPA